MHQQFANGFYGSEAWKQCRKAYAKSKGLMCERCLQKGLVVTRELQVHHRTELTPENITNPDITLNWDNLELLCKTCHDEAHAQRDGRGSRRWQVDEQGRVLATSN